MSVSIKAHLRSLASKHALRGWFDGKSCPREDYFQSVHDLIEIWRSRLGVEPAHDVVANFLADLLDQEGALYQYVDDNDQEINTEDYWTEVCLAAAFVVIDRYEQAIKDEEWKPDS